MSGPVLTMTSSGVLGKRDLVGNILWAQIAHRNAN
jgi:hypothetical protein